MLKFRFSYTGKYFIGFARRYNVSGDDRYLIVLLDGVTLTIAPVVSGQSENVNTWFQVPKEGELMHENDLIQILGAALRTAKEV